MVMKMQASAGRWSKKNRCDLRDHCESLSLKATLPGEAELLAALVNALAYEGGTIRINRKGHEPFVWHVPKGEA